VITADIDCQGPGSDGLDGATILMLVMIVPTYLVAQPEIAEADVLIATVARLPAMSADHQQWAATAPDYAAASAALARIAQNLAA